MKTVPKHKVIYSFSPKHKPAEHVKPGEKVLLELGDAFGGQMTDENVPIDELNWSRVNGATGPIFIEKAYMFASLVVDLRLIKWLCPETRCFR